MGLIDRLRKPQPPALTITVDGTEIDLRRTLAMSRRVRDFDSRTPAERDMAATLSAVLEQALDHPGGRHSWTR